MAKNKGKVDDPHAYCATIERTIKERRKKKRAKGEAEPMEKCAECEALAEDIANAPVYDLTSPEYKEMFEKEKAEHPNFTDDQIRQIVEDHMKKNVKGEGQDPETLSLDEMVELERKKHPDLSDEQLQELVKIHIREMGHPSTGEYKENYKETHEAEKKLNNRITFGLEDIPFFNHFNAGQENEEGDIPLIGTYLDFEKTTNGWRIDPAEEENLVSDQGKVTFRVAHSKEPERVIGEYKRFWAAEGDGCVDAYGNELGRHIDFEAVTNPQDPQLRVNIHKGWVNDISPGLDAEVFCAECGEAWGLDQDTNQLVKTCEHTEADGVLRNIKKKEGSMVTEPAFEGRTQFMPALTFAMAMNKIFSRSPSKSEAVGRRVSPDKEGSTQPVTADSHKEKGETLMDSTKESEEGHRAEANTKTKKVEGKALKYAEGEGEDEGEDEDARIRAALKGIGRLKKFEDDLAKLGYTKKSEDLIQPEKVMEGEDEGLRKAVPSPTKTGKPAKVMEGEDEDEGGDEDAAPLEKGKPAGPGTVAPTKPTGVPVASVSGAQVPSAEPNLGNKPVVPVAAIDKLHAAFEAEMVPQLKARFRVN